MDESESLTKAQMKRIDAVNAIDYPAIAAAGLELFGILLEAWRERHPEDLRSDLELVSEIRVSEVTPA